MPRPTYRHMKCNKGTETPSNLIFFDSETHEPEVTRNGGQKTLRLRLWSAIAVRLEGDKVTRRVLARGKTAHEFWAFVESRCNPRNPLWMFCHNAACDWTWLDFWSCLRSRWLTPGPVPRPRSKRTGKQPPPWVGKLVLEARPTFAVLRHDQSTVRLVDTGNYWPDRLWDIGQRFGLEKLKMPDWAETDEAWWTYCDRDCQVLEVAVLNLLKWWKAEDCGTFQMTAPAMALKNFRHTTVHRTPDGEHMILKEEPNHPAHVLERQAYFGGRVEAFYVGKIPDRCWKVDVNGAYLHAMAQHTYPVSRVACDPNVSPAELLQACRIYGGVAEVTVEADFNTYPYSPPLHPLQLHCHGRFRTTLCGPELVRALEAWEVVAIHKAQLYTLCPLFKEWATKWHDRKVAAEVAGDAGQREFCKLIGLSLYGKWAQHGVGWRDRLDLGYEPHDRMWIGPDPATGEEAKFRSVCGVIQQWVTGDEPSHCHPAISAFICAHAREYMRTIIRSLPYRSVFYLGTDGLVIDDYARRKLEADGMIHPTQLGSLKLEGPFEDGEIVGTNLYRVGEQWVRAGLHGRPRPDGKGKLVSETWEKLPGLILRGFDGTVRVETLPWKDPDPRAKGVIGRDGWVRPYRLPCPEVAGDTLAEVVRGRRGPSGTP